jgi:isoleucyl-tRNA synthetase
MGGFYLDIIKDRIYTCAEDSLPRRSAQTALYHIAEAFARWISPILSFTAQEIWDHLPGEREKYVFISHWYPLQPLTEEESISQQDWANILLAKEAINKVIEDQRNQGGIKGSLEADIKIFADSELFSSLAKLGQELRFVTITSKAELFGLEDALKDAADSQFEGLKVLVEKSTGHKCVRCWHYIDDVGSNDEHPSVCGRCIENIDGQGETRHYA